MSYLKALKAERRKLDRAIRVLEGPKTAKRKYTKKKKSGNRKWSAASRKRLSEALKAKWAQRKKVKAKASGKEATAA